VEGLVGIIGAQGEPEMRACVAAPGAGALAYVSIAEPSGEVCADNLYTIAPLPNQRAAAQETAARLAATQGGTLTVADYLETVQLPANDSFVAALRERDSTATPTPEAARAFDAVRLVAAAVAAGGADRAAVLAALPSARADGPRGPVTFPAGKRSATLHMFVGRTGADGKVEPVSFRPAVAPEPGCG
jgi:ABC-type branched-subunit amino acid transport system substrate-binding protein